MTNLMKILKNINSTHIFTKHSVLIIALTLILQVVLFHPMFAETNTACTSYNNCLAKGDTAYNNNDMEEAAIHYLKAIDLAKKDILSGRDTAKISVVYNKMGIIYLSTDDLSNALIQLDIALQYDPWNLEVYANRADIYKTLSMPDKAEADYETISNITSGFYTNFYQFIDFASVDTRDTAEIIDDAPDDEVSVETSNEVDGEIEIENDNEIELTGESEGEIAETNSDEAESSPDIESGNDIEDDRLADDGRLIVELDEANEAANIRDVFYEVVREDYREVISDFDIDEANKYYFIALDLAADEQYRAALDNLNLSLLIDPNNAEAYNLSGFINYHWKEDYKTALNDLNMSTLLKPDFAYPYANRGYIYYIQKEFDKSFNELTNAIRLKDDYSKAYYILSRIDMTFQEYNTALSNINYAIEIDNNWGLNTFIYDAYNIRGSIYNKLKLYDKAIADLKEAVELEPGHAKAYNNLGTAYFYKEEYETALSFYNISIALDSSAFVTFQNRGITYSYLNDYDQGILDFNRAISLNPVYIPAFKSRGLAYYNMGMDFLAIEDLKRAARLGDDSSKDLLLKLFYIDSFE